MAKFYDIQMTDMECIRSLWEKNRVYHENMALHFRDDYKNASFDRRMDGFRKFSSDLLKISVAEEGGELIGYCISGIEGDTGELETLHVDERSRGTGAGKKLVEDHIRWMKEKGCKTIGVTVAPENEKTIGFYERLGFFPNTIYMRMEE